MKRMKMALGITLLEVMLVLAIASMIIVMSIRYYQSATAAQQVNTTLETIQGIVAAADSLSQATGSYTGLTKASLEQILPGGGSTTAWGTDMLSALSPTANTYVITLGNIPKGVCPLLASKLATNNHFSAITCPTTTSITYTSNP